MTIWIILLLAGILTFTTRLSFILLLGRWEIPVWLRRALRFVPPAVLSAIIFPEVFLHSGKLDISYSNARLLAAGLAVVVAWRSKNALLTIVVGMLTLWLFYGMGWVP